MQNIIFNCKCYSLYLCDDYDNYKELEYSNKILLPKWILKKIKNKLDIDNSRFFKIEKTDSEGYDFIQSINKNEYIICEVHEFKNDIDCVFIPFYLMQKLWLSEGTPIKFECFDKHFSIGEKIIIGLCENEILNFDQENIKQELFDKYSVISKGDIIPIFLKENIINLDIIDTFPSENILLDKDKVEIEFICLDSINNQNIKDEECQELEKEKQGNTDQGEINKNFTPFSGKGYRLGGEV